MLPYRTIAPIMCIVVTGGVYSAHSNIVLLVCSAFVIHSMPHSTVVIYSTPHSTVVIYSTHSIVLSTRISAICVPTTSAICVPTISTIRMMWGTISMMWGTISMMWGSSNSMWGSRRFHGGFHICLTMSHNGMWYGIYRVRYRVR